MCGTLWFTRKSLVLLTGNRPFSEWASLLVILMSWANLSLGYELWYRVPYDIPSLFFFSACIYLILSRNFLAFYPVFVLATFNRETSIFLVLFFAICEWESGLVLMLHLFAQVMLWIATKAYLRHLFRANGTVMADVHHLKSNLHFLMNPSQWPQLASIFAFMLPVIFFGFHWIRDRRIQFAVLSIFPLWFALMMVVGVIIEIRVFNELSALSALAVGLILFHRRRAVASTVVE